MGYAGEIHPTPIICDNEGTAWFVYVNELNPALEGVGIVRITREFDYSLVWVRIQFLAKPAQDGG